MKQNDKITIIGLCCILWLSVNPAQSQMQIKGSTGTPFVTVSSTGQVGIGTTSPQTQLHTVGTVRFAGTLGTGTTADQLLVRNVINGNVFPLAWPTGLQDGDNDIYVSAVGIGGTGSIKTITLTRSGTGSPAALTATWIDASGSGADGVVTGASFTNTTNKVMTLTRSIGANITASFADWYVTAAPVTGTATKTMILSRNGASALTSTWQDYDTNNYLTGATVSGTTAKTLTLSRAGTGTTTPITASWTDVGIGGTGVATRVAFWNGTNSLGSDANLFWSDGNDRLDFGAAGTAMVGLKANGVAGGHVGLTLYTLQANSAGDQTTFSISANSDASEGLKITTSPAGNPIIESIGTSAININDGLYVSQDVGTTAPLATFNSTNADGYGVSINTYDTGLDKYALRVTSNNGSTPGLIVANKGWVGIGTLTPGSLFNVVFDNVRQGYTNDVTFERYENTADHSPIRIHRARGTYASPQNLQNGDGLSGITEVIYVGGAWVHTSNIASYYVGNGTDNKSRMLIGTSGSTSLWLDEFNNVAIGTTDAAGFKLAVNGTAAKPGGGAWSTYSDGRFKTPEADFTYGLAEIERLNPVKYRYTEGNPFAADSRISYVGLIAQEVQKVIPEAVKTDERGILTLNNEPIIWTMLNAIKELKVENEALKLRLEKMEKAP